jgi:hypothetical protein
MIFAQLPSTSVLPTNVWEFLGYSLVLIIPTIPAILAYMASKNSVKISTENKALLVEATDKLDGRLADLMKKTEEAAEAKGHARGLAQGEMPEKARAIIVLAEAKALSLKEIAARDAKYLLETAKLDSDRSGDTDSFIKAGEKAKAIIIVAENQALRIKEIAASEAEKFLKVEVKVDAIPSGEQLQTQMY